MPWDRGPVVAAASRNRRSHGCFLDDGFQAALVDPESSDVLDPVEGLLEGASNSSLGQVFLQIVGEGTGRQLKSLVERVNAAGAVTAVGQAYRSGLRQRGF
ncbi:MAG: hypothetical protein U0Q18_00375 [Bryobacteraceae bacterium]